jgi:hypothetical protein
VVPEKDQEEGKKGKELLPQQEQEEGKGKEKMSVTGIMDNDDGMSC